MTSVKIAGKIIKSSNETYSLNTLFICLKSRLYYYLIKIPIETGILDGNATSVAYWICMLDLKKPQLLYLSIGWNLSYFHCRIKGVEWITVFVNKSTTLQKLHKILIITLFILWNTIDIIIIYTFLLNISKFADYSGRIYSIYLKDVSRNVRNASYISLLLEIGNEGRLRTNI